MTRYTSYCSFDIHTEHIYQAVTDTPIFQSMEKLRGTFSLQLEDIFFCTTIGTFLTITVHFLGRRISRQKTDSSEFHRVLLKSTLGKVSQTAKQMVVKQRKVLTVRCIHRSFLTKLSQFSRINAHISGRILSQ